MSVVLPTNGIAHAQPRFLDYGSVQGSPLGGIDNRLNRLGSRWACDFTTKPMKGDEARKWIARLIRGRKEKAVANFPQPGVSSAPLLDNTVAIAADANAEIVSLGHSNVGGTFKEGAFLNLIVSATKYHLYQIKADAPAIFGVATAVQIQPPLRAPAVVGDAYRIGTPLIEGYVVGDHQSWTIDNAKIYGLSFTIQEAE